MLSFEMNKYHENKYCMVWDEQKISGLQKNFYIFQEILSNQPKLIS